MRASCDPDFTTTPDGDTGRTRTGAWRFCGPLPFFLATVPKTAEQAGLEPAVAVLETAGLPLTDRSVTGGRERNRTPRRREPLTPFRAELLVHSDPYQRTSNREGGGCRIPQAADAAGWYGGVAPSLARRPRTRLDPFKLRGRRESRTPTGSLRAGLADRRDNPIFACLPKTYRFQVLPLACALRVRFTGGWVR